MNMDKWMQRVATTFVDGAIDDETYRFTYRNGVGDELRFCSDRLELVINFEDHGPVSGPRQLIRKLPLDWIAIVDLNPFYKLQAMTDVIVFLVRRCTFMFAVDTMSDRSPDLPTVCAQARRWVLRGQSPEVRKARRELRNFGPASPITEQQA